jgi:hypothetical protein
MGYTTWIELFPGVIGMFACVEEQGLHAGQLDQALVWVFAWF